MPDLRDQLRASVALECGAIPYRGWIIRHDPLPLPSPHAEYDLRPADGSKYAIRAKDEAEAREIIDRIERWNQ